MASLIVLKGSGGATLDLTRRIPMSNYAINNIRNYEEWVDSNKTIHRQLTDEKAQGDFMLKFPSVAEYVNFVNFIARHSDQMTGAILCDAWLNNEHRQKEMYVFLEFEPDNELPLLADNKAQGFQVTLQERGF